MYPSWKNDSAFRLSSKSDIEENIIENNIEIDNNNKWKLINLYEYSAYISLLFPYCYIINSTITFIFNIYAGLSLSIIYRNNRLLLLWVLWIIITVYNIFYN